MSLRHTIEVVSRLADQGAITQYAIAGAVAALNYIQPTFTEDLDILVSVSDFDEHKSGLLLLTPIETALAAMGYTERSDVGIWIEGWPVQFLPVASAMDEEALTQAQTVAFQYGDEAPIHARILRAEHVVATALKLGRFKDLARVEAFLDQKAVDLDALKGVLAMFEQAFKKHRRRPPERSRLHHRTRLHRADLLAAVPEIPRRAGAGQAADEAAGREEIQLHPRQALSLGKLGRAQGQGRQARPQQGHDRRRPARLRQRQALSLPARLQAARHGPNTIEYKIGEIFGEIKNKIQSGYNLREIIDHIDELRFRSQTEKHELSHLYEAKIKNMGNAGRNGGEYYTPRPLIRAIVKVVKPQIGERIYDGACGSAGFLCESFEYLKAKHGLTTKEAKTLQERTFYGKEKKSLAYVIAIMNMILHGLVDKF
jgi:hypothetical protein